MRHVVGVEHRHVVANGVRCHALEAGSGPPLVLLHGTAIDSAALTYGPSLEQLAVHHRVLALDWPGYGRSERPRALPTMDDTVALLQAFLDAMGLARVHLGASRWGPRSASGSRVGAIGQSLVTAGEIAWSLERRSVQRQSSTGRARAAPISARPMQRSSRRRAG